jgi:hypothetical protein
MNDDIKFEYDTSPQQLQSIQFEKDAFYLLMSSRKSGKSVMIKELVYILLQRRLVEHIYVFSATAHEPTAGYDWCDAKCKFDENLIDEGITALMKVQELAKNNRRKMLIILDDIDLDRTYKSSIDKLASRGRHMGITTILSCQITNGTVTHAIKANSQYIFLRTLTPYAISKEVYNMLQNTNFNTPKELVQFVKKNRSDYQFIVYLNANLEPEDTIKIIKATERKYKYVCKDPKRVKAIQNKAKNIDNAMRFNDDTFM